MAKMHSRGRGRSGSKRPAKKTIPAWIRHTPKEIEVLVAKLAKEGKSPSQIGLALRDVYGIPIAYRAIGKKLTKILEEKKLLGKLPEDLMALIKKSISIKKHLEGNSGDESARRGLLLTESKIKRLVKYYKRTGKLSEDWKYEPDRIRLYIE